MKLSYTASIAALSLAAGVTLVAGCSGIGSGSAPDKLIIYPADLRAERPMQVYPCVRDGVVVDGYFTNGTVANFTGRANWTSSRPDLVQVTNGTEKIPETPSLVFGKGVLRAIKTDPAIVTISADFAGLHASIPVIVQPAPTFKISAVTSGASFATPNSTPQLAVGSRMGLALFTSLGGHPRTLGSGIEWLFDVGGVPVPDTDPLNPVSKFVTLGEFTGSLHGLRADEGGNNTSAGPIPTATVAFSDAIDPAFTDCKAAETTLQSNPVQIRVGNVASVALANEAGFSADGQEALKSGQSLSLLGTLDFSDGNGPQPNPQDLSLQSHFEELCMRRTCDSAGANCSDAQDVSCTATDKLCPALTAPDATNNNATYCRLDTHFLVTVPNYPVALTAAFTPTTLALPVTDTVTTSISVVPFNVNQSPEWILVTDSEEMLVKSIDVSNPSITVLTVVRGYRGSTAATHAGGAAVLPAPSHFQARYPATKGDDTTITNAIDSSTTGPITLASIAHYPIPPWEGIIDAGLPSQEIVLVTAVTNATTDLTVVRGYDNSAAHPSSAQAHNAGATFSQFVVAAPGPVNITPANGTMTVMGMCPMVNSASGLCPAYTNGSTINAFDTVQLEAVGTYSDTINAPRQQIISHLGLFSGLESPKIVWTTSDSSVAVVSGGGLLSSTGECGGNVVVRARVTSSTNTPDKTNSLNTSDPATNVDDDNCLGHNGVTDDPFCDQVCVTVNPVGPNPLPDGVTCPTPAPCPP